MVNNIYIYIIFVDFLKKLFSVNGKLVGAESGAKFDVHNPMNGAVIGGAV